MAKHIMSRGVWTADALKHMKEGETGVCKWCNREGTQETLTHLWWECEAFDKERARVWPEGVPDCSKLPPCLVENGLMPMLRCCFG
eukprot:14812770-Alexandrium_andersonii.AAC.1